MNDEYDDKSLESMEASDEIRDVVRMDLSGGDVSATTSGGLWRTAGREVVRKKSAIVGMALLSILLLLAIQLTELPSQGIYLLTVLAQKLAQFFATPMSQFNPILLVTDLARALQKLVLGLLKLNLAMVQIIIQYAQPRLGLLHRRRQRRQFILPMT